MSGGHWQYMSRALAEQGRRISAMHEFMAQAEHELDWGICGDSCIDCAKLRVVASLIKYFDTPHDASVALAIMRDGGQNQCDHCKRHREQ